MRAILRGLILCSAFAPPARAAEPPQDTIERGKVPTAAEVNAGKEVYSRNCVTCHKADGASSPRVDPPLNGNALLQSADPPSTLRVILDGALTEPGRALPTPAR